MAERLHTARTPENCRWTQIRHLPLARAAQRRSEALWVCVRSPGAQRPVTDRVCAGCEFWEPFDEAEHYMW